ncbi:MAG: phosphoserine phosphatase SerB [Methanobacteriota archaeon]|nr:MAG: phosphoserine phosphatase SerB [Euryarchaeota archaeon]
MDRAVVTVLGKDRKGLIAGITGFLARAGINITDIKQSVVQGLFTMFMTLDLSTGTLSYEEMEKGLLALGRKLGVEIEVTPFSEYRGSAPSTSRNLYAVVVLGRDRPGIVADMSSIFHTMGMNIESTNLTARGDLISVKFIVDIEDRDPETVREAIKKAGERVGLDVVVLPQERFKREKRLIVFDMDSTITDVEVIDAIAKEAGVEEEVKCITEKAMCGDLEFKKALRERVRLLAGLPLKTLENIAENLTLTPGTEELLATLKAMGYKTALISGGFTIFTEKLKERLGFDYAFANRLEVRDGRLTGRLKGRIIDAEEKGRIIEMLARKEKISTENIVAVGDGANDQIMIKNAGLGIAFNAKDLLKKISDGTISKKNLAGLLNVLGAEER